ncbi:MAG: glycosyltransferase family 4 protein [Bacteroidetes bacterium]|nr:glycosyltransferase family 4 protein [Bacteroidota bacterium]MBS1649256.1 glycosyltransferase family 4 protein [Bacteroidota bacterium]
MNLLYIGEKPIQNTKPYQLLNTIKNISYKVVYTGNTSNINKYNNERINQAAFNINLLEGYNYISANGNENIVLNEVSKCNVMVVYGHYDNIFKKALLKGKLMGKKIILTTDATTILGSYESGGWKIKIKPIFLKLLYNVFANAVFVPSTVSKKFLQSVGIKESKIIITPYVVNEDYFQTILQEKNNIREKHNIHSNAVVFVFCAKFLERKNPLDAVEAFAKINNSNAVLIMIGDGPLKETIQNKIADLNLADKVIMPGIVTYSELPLYYAASNVLLFTSSHEPYGLPVNEAMLCGIPAIVSDSIGARLDLVHDAETGFVYKTGNINALSVLMQQVIDNPELFKQMGNNAKQKMKYWSSEVNVQNQLNFFKQKGWLK